MDVSAWLAWPRLLYWLIPLLVLCAAPLAYWLWRRHHRPRRELDRILRRHAHEVLYDLVIPDGLDGHIHLDYLLLTDRGLLVVDTLDVQGVVFGAPRMDEWAVMQGHNRHAFRNPLYPLQDRVAAVKHLTGGKTEVEGVVAFCRGAEFPRGVPEGTRTHDSLAARSADSVPGDAPREAWQKVVDSLKSEV